MNRKARKISRFPRGLVLACLLLAIFFAAGCKVSKDDGRKERDLEFTVVGKRTAFPWGLERSGC